MQQFAFGEPFGPGWRVVGETAGGIRLALAPVPTTPVRLALARRGVPWFRAQRLFRLRDRRRAADVPVTDPEADALARLERARRLARRYRWRV